VKHFEDEPSSLRFAAPRNEDEEEGRRGELHESQTDLLRTRFPRPQTPDARPQHASVSA